MSNPVIVRVVKYIPRDSGNVVYEAFEEVEVSPGKWLPLDPRNPTPEEVQSADDKAIAQQQATIARLTAERDSLTQQLSAMTTERDTALSAKEVLLTSLTDANETIETLQARIDELENPPNPFPNSDWQGFRSAALASPVIMRMAVSNIGNFMMLLIYLTEMQKDPATSLKMAGVWNEMETKTPLSPEEIASINSLAANYQVPMVLNSEGQIVLP